MDDRQQFEFYRSAFHALMRCSTDGFVMVDREGVITDFSPVYAHFLGSEPELIIGRKIEDVIPVTEMYGVMDHDRVDRDVVQALNTMELRDDSRERLVTVSRAPIYAHSSGEVCGAVSHVRFYSNMMQFLPKLSELYAQLSISRRDEYYALAYARLQALAPPQHSSVHGKGFDRQAMLLQYYQDEVKKNSGRNDRVVGNSEAFNRVRERACRAAQTNFSVLITGETGTGKEVLADIVHDCSFRSKSPFIKINCAAIPDNLLESELFGYWGGAFTGALREGKKGKFQLADSGSIFLDEIGDMPMSMQAKLLRVLQSGEIEPVGATGPVKVDVRIIAATRQDIPKAIQEGRFREDLYYRLNEVSIHMPRLADRTEDIRILAQNTLDQINQKYKTSIIIEDNVFDALEGYGWPGNIRELNNIIKGAYSVAEDGRITLYHLPAHIACSHQGNRKSAMTLDAMLSYYEKQIIQQALRECGHNVAQAAERLGIHRSNLYKKLEKHGLPHPKDKRQP